MFYWNRQTENGTTLEQELTSCNKVKKIQIASAFLSDEGVNVLQKLKNRYSLKKNDITIFISSKFSSNKPHELLKRLEDICVTKLVFDRSFHSKVYFIQGEENKLIYGSSNLTHGGMMENIEFDSISVPNTKELVALGKFFAYCDSVSKMINADIIQYYEDNAIEIDKLKAAQNRLGKKLSGYIYKDDAFTPDDYDIDGFYFTYEDYETFFTRNHTLDSANIRAKRKQAQEKMLKIHHKIYPQIKKLGIACHKRPENISSLIMPCVYNHYIVAWNGIRYGKTPKEIDALNYAGEKDDIYGFQKHGCLQYCIVQDGFEINLFLAVKHDAVDRYYLQENLTKLRPKIEAELKKLQGYGMQWVINDDELGKEFTFDIDNQHSTEFYDYFTSNDCDGRESFLRIYYEPDNEILESLESICDEVISTIKLLLPLYSSMVFRPKGV